MKKIRFMAALPVSYTHLDVYKRQGTHILEYYVFDPSIPSVPEKTLKVFGLSENDTVRQAIIRFQKKHTDVKVEFHTSGKTAGEVSTDDIRTLNTELLSGNGADVLLLDGLPVDSYIEKGVLEDLTDLAADLTGQDSYLEEILKNTAQSGGKIYGMPLKFKIPILFGDEEVKAALESIDTLQAYMDANPDEMCIRDSPDGGTAHGCVPLVLQLHRA